MCIGGFPFAEWHPNPPKLPQISPEVMEKHAKFLNFLRQERKESKKFVRSDKQIPEEPFCDYTPGHA